MKNVMKIMGAVVMIAATNGSAQNPSPMLKQLRIGCYTYSSSSIWTDDNFRNWYANRYSHAVGTGNSGDILAMKSINPQMINLVYDVFVLDASDTSDVKQWAQLVGVDFNSLVIRTGPSVGDSVRLRVNDDPAGNGFARWVTTPGGGRIVLQPGYTNAQTRFVWDFRNPLVGAYLAYRWRNLAQSISCDGVMVDEETISGYTNLAPAGNYPIHFPFREISSNLWAAGSPYTSLNRNWGNSFDIPPSRGGDADNVHSYVPDVRDSLNLLRNGWMKVAGDSMAAYGLLYSPNFAANPTSLGTYLNFENEGRHAAVLARSYQMGEYSYFYPGGSGSESNCMAAIKACHSVKDSSLDFFVDWVRMGQFDSSSGIGFSRSRMSGLGLWLECLFPGTTRFYFSPCVQNGQVDYGGPRTLGGITAMDSLTMWDNAWTKYFGEPLTTRDSTSSKGTDPAGQSYSVHKTQLMNPQNPSQVLTWVFQRYARGSNFGSGSAVGITLPSGTWYELLPDASTNRNSSNTARWGSPQSGGTSFTLRNSECRIFSSDTLLSNNGPSGGTDVTAPAKVNDLGAVPGSSFGDIILSWTAPGDDANSGRAFAYEIRYRDSVDGPIDVASWSAATVLNKSIVVLPAGSRQTLVVSDEDGLIPGPYFFALTARDEVGNESEISNSPSAHSNESIASGGDTLCAPVPQSPIGESATLRPILTVENTNCDTVGENIYYFELAEDNLFSTNVVQSPGVNETPNLTSWQVPADLVAGTPYYWRARANSWQNSATTSFTISLTPYAYPTVFRPDGSSTVTFSHLPANGSLTVLATTGEIVRRWENVSASQISWDGKNSSGETVGSGVYLWYLENSDTKGKLIVVR